MEQTIKLKLQPLTAEAFHLYGQVLQLKHLIYPETEEGRVAMEMLRLPYYPQAKRMTQLAIHFSYNQTFIPLRGSLALVVAPPPRNREANPESYELDYERVAAFVVEPGEAAFIYKGTWHNALSLGAECTLINVTRKNLGEGSSRSEDLEGLIEREKEVRPYVEYVDLKKRDNRLIEVEL
ncbi:MAG TPA: ureidoglycolate lyase [Candidatus Binatia bacterium]|nr:ureidoglycolate lyase [Candidatus Binatia bacterium]